MANLKTYSTACLIAVLFCSAINSAFAQYNDAGMLVGLSSYHGDLSSNPEPSNFRTGFGVNLRRHFSPRFAGRIQFTTGVLTAHDKYATSLAQRQRNLSFRSEFVELHAAAEWNLSRFDILDGRNSAPFATVGIGAMYFNPQADYLGMYYDLQPMGTEGQGLSGQKNKYKRLTAQVPVGLGFKWALNKKVMLQAQVLHHFTFTDYLDDVSGNYADIEALRGRDPRSAHLAYRTPELLPDQQVVNPEGQLRGDNRRFDRFTNVQIGVSFIMGDKYDLEWNQEYRIYDDAKPARVKRKNKGLKLFKRKKTIEGVF